MGNTLKTYLLRYLRELRGLSVEELLEKRYQKFRRMGQFDEGLVAEAAALNGTAEGIPPPAAARSTPKS